jgi:hypothetical protein
MADQNKIAEMLEHLVNDDQAKAEELFHEYIVAKSREIYEDLIESEIEEASDEDEEVDEAAEKDEDQEDEDLDENFEDLDFAEAGDETDDLVADAESDDEDGDEGEDEMGDEEGDESEESIEDRVMDLEDHMAELEAEFAKLQSEEEGEPFHSDDMGDEMGDEPMKDEFELETVREYVEKVAPAKMGDNGANAKSIVAGKNDMGGTTANIAKGGESKGEGTKGGLANPSAKEDNAGNINVPGGKAGSAFSKKEPGHGAEKKGAAEQADNKASLFSKLLERYR